MAKVTIELCNVLNIQTFKLFDFDYPIEDIGWKAELEAAIIDYFYFHEIGQETIDRFKHVFRSRLQLIIPQYNELFRSRMFVVNPLLTHQLEETMEDTKGISSTSSATSDSVLTEYPEHVSVLDDIATNKSKTDSSNTQGTTATHDYKKVISGYQGVNANQMLTEYRKNIVNINQLIINDLKQCFIMIY